MLKESQIAGMSRSRNFKDKQKVAHFLGTSFSDLHDKENGWDVLLKLTYDSNKFVKISAIKAISPSFVYIRNKEEAWQRLLVLIEETDKEIRNNAMRTMRKTLFFLPNEQNTWKSLIEITKRSSKVDNYHPLVVLHDCFDNFEDKETIVDDLKELIKFENPAVRGIANNLIGRVYVSKSVRANGAEFNKIYSEGIIYLKKGFNELGLSSHKFCYVMHNLFIKIIEGKLENPDEIKNGIEDLKTASETSPEKQKIVRILNDLDSVLRETLEAQKKGEDISRFRDKIIPICTQLDMLIGSLNNNIIRIIAEKAREKIHFEYISTVRALEIVNELLISPVKLKSEPDLIVEAMRLCCISLTEPLCNSYKLKLKEIEKENDPEKKCSQQRQFISELKPILEYEKGLKEIIVSGHNEIKNEIIKTNQKLDEINRYIISVKQMGLRQEIVVSSGIDILGNGAQVVTTIPINEIGYAEIQEDVAKIKNNMRLNEIPNKLKEIIIKRLPTKSKSSIV